MNLRIEYYYDPESHGWSFRVPSLGIIGGADTREEAEKQVMDAIDFTLECENEQPAPPHVEVRYLQLTPQHVSVAS